jgi:hypothetical protein
VQNQGAKSHCAATSFSAKALHPTPVTAHPVTGLFPLLGKAALRAVHCPVSGGDEVTVAKNALPILVTNAQDLFMQSW